MLDNKNKIFLETRNFLTTVTKNRLPVVNSVFLTKQPATQNRIEFKFTNFRNMSHNYDYVDKSGDSYTFGVDATYKAQLIIRVISTPDEAMELIGNISNALQIFEYRDMFMPSISLLNHTLRQVSIPVEKNGTIFNLEQIIVDCNIVLPYDVDIDFFTKIEDVKIIIKE